MTWSYGDPSENDLYAVRLLIPDNDEAHEDAHLLSDEEILFLISLEGDVRRAAAAALEVIATNEALVLKVMKVLDTQTDGAKLAETLLKRAQRLRDNAILGDDEDDAGFDIAELVYDDFTYRERLLKELQRGGL